MDWEHLLCRKYLTETDPEPSDWKNYSSTEFGKDYKTIVSSSAFRRLQDKTQVFPLDKSDFVRTRLTHSMETATIAKELGSMVCEGCRTWKKGRSFPESYEPDVCDILMCVGLLHDLGNPPFGHFGESSIGDWFKKAFKDESLCFRGKPVGNILNEQMKNDLQYFEGNAQSLRLVLKYGHSNSTSDLKLSYGVIQSLVKYPVNSINCKRGSGDIREHKYGIFLADEDTYKGIANETRTFRESKIERHPLAYILEAADDIAYATADLEDALKKGLITLDTFISFYNSELSSISSDYLTDKSQELIHNLETSYDRQKPFRSVDSELKVFGDWIKLVRGWLMYVVAFDFVTNYDVIISGKWKDDLFHGTFHQETMSILKKAMSTYVYDSDMILLREVSANTILSFLLDKFVPAAIHFDETGEHCLSEPDRKCMSLIPEDLVNDYRDAKKENKDEAYLLYLRLLMVTDFISGMTDSYARNLYLEISGVTNL